MTAEHDSKRIVRQWNREIEDDARRRTQRERDRGPWRAVVWGILWLLWLGVVIVMMAPAKTFG